MEIKLAKHAGFCFGVKRAVDKVYEQLESGKKIYTYGPIIHNEEVVNDLEKKGISVIDQQEDLLKITNETIIIRSHGVAKEIYDLLENRKIDYIDLTCPFVKRIHKIVHEKSLEGYFIIIIGNAGHPEVDGIVGWCTGECAVLETPQEALQFNMDMDVKLCIVSQTTFNYNKFQDIVEIFQKRGYNVNVANTICNATEERQTEAKQIAMQADAMIVIGGKHSSNTRKLYEICSKECENTYFIQTLEDLHLEIPKAAQIVGITAGASTPNKLIEEVQNYVRINF